ncbi:MAG: phosphatidate cytidylyltransferase [Micavibrio sp.]|nr:phosphatidate cytidylyltransferase [Micavibrio sp.]
MKISSDLIWRIISALVLIPLVFGFIYHGGFIYYGSVICCFLIVSYEWIRMSLHAPHYKMILGVVGVLYFLGCLWAFIYLRFDVPQGTSLVVFIVTAIWVSDIAGYVAGKTLKGPKIVPKISPNKTWSGFIAAIILPALYFMLFSELVGLNLNTLTYIFFLTIGFWGQIGDFTVSMMKRYVGVKDTGSIIPGHGGLLDRIDALIFIMPIFTVGLLVLKDVSL